MITLQHPAELSVTASETKMNGPDRVVLTSGGELSKKNFQRAFPSIGIDCRWNVLLDFQ
jgi:hypothetical protein